jgi:glycogen debranching enzyme
VEAEPLLAVLEENWTGAFTKPGPHLYPHQWSWDAGFIAIGWAGHRPARARAELRFLLAHQWPTGMVPHIVFAPGLPESEYFPGPGVWRAGGTSAICQPPIHATAALAVHRADHDEDFLADVVPRLERWHEYLHRDRDPEGTGLPVIRHPWESGQDNSPMWDAALAAVHDGSVEPYERSDVGLVHVDERPTVDEYDGYLRLVAWLRDRGYDEAQIAGQEPFRVVDPLTCALLVQADRDLVELTEELREDPAPARARADRTAAALEEHCWSEEHGLYLAQDRVTGAPVDAPAAGGLVPLFAGVPSPARAERIVETLTAAEFWPLGGFPAASFDTARPEFDRARYWRGPSWVNVNWLLCRGLQRYGRTSEAELLRGATLGMVEAAGPYEYFDPFDGRGRGSPRFSWTAALALDLLDD